MTLDIALTIRSVACTPYTTLYALLLLCCCTEKVESAIATVVIRGATDNIMDDVERAVDDGINTFKALTRVRPAK